MSKFLIEATDRALRSVTQMRFYQSERGFQGRFYCSLQAELDAVKLTDAAAILEMEYQKRALLQGMRQRPDIILHIPAEHSGAPRDQNNFCVWALKLGASPHSAQDDFEKLDDMFVNLAYPLGIFVNIASESHWVEHYAGRYPQRLVGVAAHLNDGSVTTNWSRR